MITKMTGVLTRLLTEESEARLQVGPLEYQVLIPESARRHLHPRTGQTVTFHVTEFLEGNGGGNRFIPRRIGFLTEAELEFFDLFCTVDKIGVKNTGYVSPETAHEFLTWRRSLHEFAPLLFRD